MNEKEEQTNVLYYKTEIFPGAYTITGPFGNIFKNAGVKTPFPLSEELADVLIEDLNYVYDDGYEMPVYENASPRSLEYSELDALTGIKVPDVIAAIMKAKNDNNYYHRYTGLDIDNALADDSLLKHYREGPFLIDQDYIHIAKEYFRKYDLSITKNNSVHCDILNDDILLGMVIENELGKLNRPEMISFVYLFKKLKGFSVILPLLWVKNVIDDTDLAWVFLDSLFMLDHAVDFENITLNDIGAIEEVLTDKLYFMREAIDIYIEDAIKMFHN